MRSSRRTKTAAPRKTQPENPSPPDRSPRPILWATVLIAAGIAAYSNSFSGPFIYDDRSNIHNNPAVQSLWPLQNAMWAPPAAIGVTGRPVVNLSLAVDHAMHGLSPSGYHATNLIIHVLTSIVLFGVVRRTLLTRSLTPRFGPHTTPLAFAAAIVWEIHPLLCDSVAYISARTELLAGLFLLLTLYCAIRGSTAATRRARLLWRSVAIACCVIGTGCKEIMVAAPVVVLLYDWVFRREESAKELVRRNGLFYAALFATLVLIPLNLSTANFHRSARVVEDSLTTFEYLKLQAQVVIRYLRLCFWPDPLLLDYSGVWPRRPSLGSVVPQAMVVLTLLATTGYGLLRRVPAAYAGAWFFVILAPTSSFLPLPTEIATERRMYVPLMAVIALVVLIAWHGLQRFGEKRLTGMLPKLPLIAAAILSPVIAAELWRTLQRNDEFRDPIALWADIAAHQPNNRRAYINLADEFYLRGQYDYAQAAYREIVRISPSELTAWNNLATIDIRSGNYDDAIASLRSALAAKPDYAFAYQNLAHVYYLRGEFEESERNVREAVRLESPSKPERLMILARALAARGAFAESEKICRETLTRAPDVAAVHDVLGVVLARTSREVEAVAAFGRAIQLGPRDPDFKIHLAWLLATASDPAVRNPSTAVQVAKQASDSLNAQDAPALDALALSLAADGKFDDAAVVAKRAVEIAAAKHAHQLKKFEGRRAGYVAGKMPEGELRTLMP